jgi:hypothetical protein
LAICSSLVRPLAREEDAAKAAAAKALLAIKSRRFISSPKGNREAP